MPRDENEQDELKTNQGAKDVTAKDVAEATVEGYEEGEEGSRDEESS
jgi:hypothetical protein